MGYPYALLVISVAVVAAVLFVAMPHVGARGPQALFLRLAAASGIAAVGASVLYLAYGSGGGSVALALGDMCMVLVPLLLFVAVRTLEGRRALRTSLLAFVVAIVVAVVTSLTPLPDSLAVKVAVLAATCGACAWAAARAQVEPRAPMLTIAIATGGYSLFSLARLAVAAVLGWGSPPYAVGFSFLPAMVVGSLVILAIGIAVVQLRVLTRGAPERASTPRTGTIVVVGDWSLASAAYGPDRVRALVLDLRAAGRALDPEAGQVPRGVEVGIPQAVAVLSERLRTAYGWTPDEIALLADGSATAALRTHPVRVSGWTWPRSTRS